MPDFSFRVPHTLVLLFGMMVVALLLTWILPSGTFETTVDEAGREVVVPGTYHTVDDAPLLPPWALLTVIPRALADAQGIIFFVLIIGGVIAVLRATGALDALIGTVIERFGNQPGLLIFGGMFTFGVASSTLGMAEEYIPFVAILVTLCVAMRLDTVAAVGIMVVGYGIGYGAAAVNPFTVLVAQDVAQLEPISGWRYRVIIFVPFLLIGFHHVFSYARKVRRDPAASLVADVPEAQPPAVEAHPVLDAGRLAILIATLAAIVLLVVGISEWDWYLVELGAVFLGLGIVAAAIGRLGWDETARVFAVGASELTLTALLIGFARAIALLLEDGAVLHTIVHYLSLPLSAGGAELSAVGMLLIQSILNFFIPSGSGQAFVTMPLMAPISDLVGVTRQVAVLAYQFGDGFMNMVVPTNAVLMGILGMTGIPYDRWFRFIWPLIVKLLAAGSVALVVAVWIGYQ